MPLDHRLAIGCAALALALTGCSAEQPDNAIAAANIASAPVEAVDPATPSNVVTGETTGGDGSQIEVSALTAADLESARLSGELGCSFSGGDATLLVAKGDVASAAPAFGIVKIGDYVEPVSTPGGYDAMARGSRFAGKGMTITVTITGAPSGGGESPPRPATLTFDRADGARRTLIGDWVCGP